MVRCGELCKSCVGRCRESVSDKFPAEIECPMCGGEGECDHCHDGYFVVSECPTKYIGQQLIHDIQICAASEYHLPVQGGLLDQSSWWFDLRQLLRNEEHLIQEEQNKRQRL